MDWFIGKAFAGKVQYWYKIAIFATQSMRKHSFQLINYALPDF